MSEEVEGSVSIENLRVCTEEDEEILQLQRDLDSRLERKAKRFNLTTVNVKSILHHLIKNPQTISLFLDVSNEVQTKLTRSKAKQLAQKITTQPLPTTSDQQASTPPIVGREVTILQTEPQDKTILDVDFSDSSDDDDEDYRPKESGLQTPSTERSAVAANSRLDTPRITPQTPRQRRTATPPCLHTRSRLPLQDVRMDTFDQELINRDPDAALDPQELENIGSQDVDWLNFIRNLDYGTSGGGEEVPSFLKDNEDEDPEFNYMAECTDEREDPWELRCDKATEIQPREVQDLIMDLIQSGDSDLLPLEYFDQNLNTPSQETEDAESPQPTQEEIPVRDWILMSNVLEGNSDLVSSVVPVHQSAPLVAKGNENEWHVPQLTLNELTQLENQLRKHVQLMAQTVLLTRDDEMFREEAETTTQMLDDIRILRNENEDSYFNTSNLDKALSIINQPLPKEEDIWEKVPKRKIATNRLIATSDGGNRKPAKHLPKPLMVLFSESEVFSYPELLPNAAATPAARQKNGKLALRHDGSRTRFQYSEECLLAIGVSLFKPIGNRHIAGCPGYYKIIMDHLLPLHGESRMLQSRIQTVLRNYPASSPLNLAYLTGSVPDFVRDDGPFEEFRKISPILQSKSVFRNSKRSEDYPEWLKIMKYFQVTKRAKKTHKVQQNGNTVIDHSHFALRACPYRRPPKKKKRGPPVERPLRPATEKNVEEIIDSVIKGEAVVDPPNITVPKVCLLINKALLEDPKTRKILADFKIVDVQQGGPSPTDIGLDVSFGTETTLTAPSQACPSPISDFQDDHDAANIRSETPVMDAADDVVVDVDVGGPEDQDIDLTKTPEKVTTPSKTNTAINRSASLTASAKKKRAALRLLRSTPQKKLPCQPGDDPESIEQGSDLTLTAESVNLKSLTDRNEKEAPVSSSEKQKSTQAQASKRNCDARKPPYGNLKDKDNLNIICNQFLDQLNRTLFMRQDKMHQLYDLIHGMEGSWEPEKLYPKLVEFFSGVGDGSLVAILSLVLSDEDAFRFGCYEQKRNATEAWERILQLRPLLISKSKAGSQIRQLLEKLKNLATKCSAESVKILMKESLAGLNQEWRSNLEPLMMQMFPDEKCNYGNLDPAQFEQITSANLTQDAQVEILKLGDKQAKNGPKGKCECGCHFEDQGKRIITHCVQCRIKFDASGQICIWNEKSQCWTSNVQIEFESLPVVDMENMSQETVTLEDELMGDNLVDAQSNQQYVNSVTTPPKIASSEKFNFECDSRLDFFIKVVDMLENQEENDGDVVCDLPESQDTTKSMEPKEQVDIINHPKPIQNGSDWTENEDRLLLETLSSCSCDVEHTVAKILPEFQGKRGKQQIVSRCVFLLNLLRESNE